MKKIAIITSGELPLPAVKGGAVENLVEFMLKNNEKEKLAEIDVFSIYNDEAMVVAKKYANSSFFYIKVSKNYKRILLIINRIQKKFLKYIRNEFSPFLYKAMRKIKKKDYDYIIIENRPTFVRKLSKLRIPIVLHLHNDSLNNSIYDSSIIMKLCHRIVVVSDYLKKQVESTSCSIDNICILKNVIDINSFQNIPKQAIMRLKNEISINNDEFVFIYSGRIVPEKGVKELIEAFSIVCKKREKVKLIIIGASWYSTEKESTFFSTLKSISSSVKNHIIFTGYVNYKNIPQYLSLADAAIVPSMWEEPAGLTVIEAMACGKPLIVSNSGGIPEYANESCAFFVEKNEEFVVTLADNMIKMIDDGAIVRELGYNAMRESKKYDMNDYLGRFLQLL